MYQKLLGSKVQKETRFGEIALRTMYDAESSIENANKYKTQNCKNAKPHRSGNFPPG